jgi:hypothetical protein
MRERLMFAVIFSPIVVVVAFLIFLDALTAEPTQQRRVVVKAQRHPVLDLVKRQTRPPGADGVKP